MRVVPLPVRLPVAGGNDNYMAVIRPLMEVSMQARISMKTREIELLLPLGFCAYQVTFPS